MYYRCDRTPLKVDIAFGLVLVFHSRLQLEYNRTICPTCNPLLRLQSAQASPATERRRFSLTDVPHLEDIKNLTTRQLKELLGRHFVDYKGCVEKHELVARVSRLWEDNRKNQDAADVINSAGGSYCVLALGIMI